MGIILVFGMGVEHDLLLVSRSKLTSFSCRGIEIDWIL